MSKANRISNLLPSALLKTLRGRQTEAEKLASVWQTIVGQDLAEHSTPASYQKEVLTVFVENASWASKLRHCLPEITIQCRQQAGMDNLKKVKIKIGLQENANQDNIHSIQKESRISRKSAAIIMESAKDIKDESLRTSLERLGRLAGHREKDK